MPPRRRTLKAVKAHTRHAQSIDVSIAMLQQQQEQTTERFVVLGEKFDRILSRVEELALHTTSLNSRHDTEIQVLQKQIASSEHLLNNTRDDINAMTQQITELVRKELADATSEMSAAVDQLTLKMERQNVQLDERVQRLERWRMFLLGGGVVGGFLLSRVADGIVRILFPISR